MPSSPHRNFGKTIRPRRSTFSASKRYHSLFDNHHTVMLLIDPLTSKIVDANPAACSYYGYSHTQLVNLKITDINTLATQEVLREMSLAKGLKRNLFHFSHRLANGEIRPVEVFSGPVTLNNKLLLYSIVHDISERRQAEQALSRELEVNAALAELSQALLASVSIDAISDLVLQHAKRLTGSRLGFVGFIDPNTGIVIRSTLDCEGLVNCQVADPETLLTKNNGLWGWVLQNRKPLLTNDAANDPRSSGTPAGHIPIQKFLSVPAMIAEKLVGLICLANPENEFTPNDLVVAQRLAAVYALAVQHIWDEKELREERDFITTVMDTAGALVVVLDPHGHIVRFNRACERATGYTFDEVKGRTIWETFLLQEEQEPVKNVFDNIVHGNFPNYFENYWLAKDGTPRLITWANTSLLGADGSVQYVVGTGIDITKHRLVEQDAQRKRIEIELHHRLMQHWENERLHIAQDLHDGPTQGLSALFFHLDELSPSLQEEAAQSKLQVVREILEQQVNEIRQMCNELRPPSLARFGLEKAIRSHVENIQDKGSGINIILQLDEDHQQLPEPVRMALFRIHQELLTNVIKHANASEIQIRFKMGEDHVVLEVQDNGKGFLVPTDWIEVVQQGHLGLVGILERAEAVGGTVTFTSAPGQGSLVLVKVPIRQFSQVGYFDFPQ